MGTGDRQHEPRAALDESLAAAVSVTEAAEAVVAYLAGYGALLPSVYLEQGGRLRCEAQRGYWQVLDGISCDVGVIGRTFRSGRTVEIADASVEEEFLFAAPDLQRQISVPVRHARRVVGTVNVESARPFPPRMRALVEEAAALFEQRLEQLGGPRGESTAQQVARLATSMTALRSEPDIQRSVLGAAIQVTGMATAAIIEPTTTGHARIAAATGPLDGALRVVDPADLGQLDEWVAAGPSLFTRGTAASDLDMHDRLQAAGVAALAVVPLTANGEHLGSLVVASDVSCALDAVSISALEILGAQAAASTLMVRAVAELEQRARQDPLTGLGHHSTFQEELLSRLAHQRPDRQLAMLMIDIDDFKAVNDRDGHQAGDRVLKQLSARLSAVLRNDDQLYRVGGDEFATTVEISEVEEADDIVRRLIDAARPGPVTISVGVAIATEGETASQLIDRADAAMYAVKRSGRDTNATAPRAS